MIRDDKWKPDKAAREQLRAGAVNKRANKFAAEY
jgi:hypothetical protein